MAVLEGSVREVHGDPFPMVDRDAGVDEPVPRKARLHLVRDQRCRKGVLQDPSCAADMFDAQTPPTSPSAREATSADSGHSGRTNPGRDS
jgi:hypothetical protein